MHLQATEKRPAKPISFLWQSDSLRFSLPDQHGMLRSKTTKNLSNDVKLEDMAAWRIATVAISPHAGWCGMSG
jgi:hypothetical protein